MELTLKVVSRADGYQTKPAADPKEKPTQEKITRINAQGENCALTFVRPYEDAKDFQLDAEIVVTVSSK